MLNFSNSKYKLVPGNVIDTMKDYNNTFDLIIADPPFGINFDKSSHEYGSEDYILYNDNFNDEKNEYEKFSHDWINSCYDGLKKNGSLYVISGWSRIRDILNAVHKTKFVLLNHIIWHFSWGVFTNRKYVTSHYHIVFLVKNPKDYLFFPQYVNPNTVRKGRPYETDVWFWSDYNRGNDPNRIKGHPCQLPLCLLSKIIRISSKKNSIIGDVFSGSGTTILASRKLGRDVIGFEKNFDYIPIIQRKAKFGQKVELYQEELNLFSKNNKNKEKLIQDDLFE